ncbi:MAG: hypothetical protein JW825_03155 [Candidatus Methanofastidiosa archaeon]|nr:hypothetical protein [Candidatus Methanofastidiosa archaeon]
MPEAQKHTKIINDVLSIIDHMRNNLDLYMVENAIEEPSEQQIEEGKAVRYGIFKNDNERDHYYSDVAICRFLFYDIANGTNIEKLSRYNPGIANIDPGKIEKVYYDEESEEFVIRVADEDFRIYRGDIRYIYPFYCQFNDSIEYELVFDGDKAYSYPKFNDGFEITIF